MNIYYNENDSFAAAWLREAMADGLIPEGTVDIRSVAKVRASDLDGYTQCHFFAGIGGWAYALRLAGWPEDRPVWTGSCPCQPFSIAGKRKGGTDERHLWPEFRRLVAECGPPVVFGEQVTGKDGRTWLAGVRADLEALGYGVGAADLCAAGVGAPHIRQRLFWVADANGGLAGYGHLQSGGEYGQRPTDGRIDNRLGGSRGTRLERSRELRSRHAQPTPWAESVAISCSDGKFRRVAAVETAQIEPALFPLADGVPHRMGALRGAGNAIVPQVAAEFVRAFLET